MYYDSYFHSKPTSLGSYFNVKLNQRLTRLIVQSFQGKKTLRICEVGLGRGLLADAIMQNTVHTQYFAIEPNSLLAASGRSKGYCIHEEKIPPFPDSQNWSGFDVIIFSHVIEHFDNYSTILKVLEESNVRLNDNGLLFVFMPDFLDYKEDFFSADYSHEYVLTTRRMIKLLFDAHFKVTKIVGFRACFKFPETIIVYLLHFVIKAVADILWKITALDIFFKLKITFARNVVVMAKKQND
jgi:predicted TPR repeat methyltransferase